MKAERWREIEGIVARALQHAPEERTRYVRSACGADDALWAEATALLDAHRRAQDGFLSRDPVDGMLALPSAVPVGETIGGYTIEGELGHGGMGSVYRASRSDGVYAGQVALKVMRRGLETADLLARFRQERQILADLDHPGIARLLDGGALTDGRPFLVMELVDGQPIDRYCDDHRLDIDARLVLFRQVCEAVQHAHRNLVVHRDLKPSNILVTDQGRVKLLDFGVAKLLEHTGRGVTTVLPRRTPMTPIYASPEQRDGRSVTTATDVFSLGVVLFELLTGTLPVDGAGAAARVGPLGRMSTSLRAGRRTDGADTGASRARATTPERLRRRLRGDLDTIVARAVAEDPDRRYPSPAALADDVRRHQDQLPVLARSDGLGYRLRRFAARHRVGVTLTALALIGLVGVAVVMSWQALALADERDRVVEERDRAERITRFFTDVFALAKPDVAGRPDASVRSVLDRGVANYADALEDQPVVQAAVFHATGAVYRSLGDLEQAERWLTQALDLRRAHLGTAHPETAATLVDLGNLARFRDRLDVGERLLREALGILERTVSPDDVRIAECLAGLAWFGTIRGALDGSQQMLDRAIDIYRSREGPEGLGVAAARFQLATIARHRGDHEASEAHLRRAADIQERALGDRHPELLTTLKSLTQTMTATGRHGEAAAVLERVLVGERALYGDQHPRLGFTLNYIGVNLLAAGTLEPAEAKIRQALALRRSIHGADQTAVGVSLSVLGLVLLRRGALIEADAALVEAMPILRRGLPSGSPEVARPMVTLAEVRRGLGRLAEAEALAREALDLRIRAEVAPLLLVESRVVLGECLLDQQRRDEASALLVAAAADLEGVPAGQGVDLRDRVRRAFEALGADASVVGTW